MLGSDRAGATPESREQGVTQAQYRVRKENLQDAEPRDSSASGQGSGSGIAAGIPSPAEISQLPTADPWQGGFLTKARFFPVHLKDSHTLPAQPVTDLLDQRARQVPGTQTFLKAKVSVPFP